MRDRSLLSRATAEVDTCRLHAPTRGLSFDAVKLCNQPLLQSTFAETLRIYVAVYIIRKPEYEDARVLDYVIPKDKMIVVSSAMAHMDKRNWNLGTMEDHPVERFWADRFLTYNSSISQSPLRSTDRLTSTGSYLSGAVPTTPDIRSEILSPLNSSDDRSQVKSYFPNVTAATPEDSKSGPKFSLNGYSGAWIPFGGGIHQCPGRHWVKLQILMSFAMISDAFDIELLSGSGALKVDMAKYGLGALQPAEKARFRIRRRKAPRSGLPSL